MPLQAMAFFEQHHLETGHLPGTDDVARRQGMTGRHRQLIAVLEHRKRYQIACFVGKSQQRGIECTGHQPVEQVVGHRLAHVKAQLRMLKPDRGQHLRQQIGGERRDRADPEVTGKNTALRRGVVHQGPRVGENPLGTVREILADRRELHAPAGPFRHDHAETFLEFLDPGAERGLGHVTAFRGVAEMLFRIEGDQKFEMAQVRAVHDSLIGNSDYSLRFYSFPSIRERPYFQLSKSTGDSPCQTKPHSVPCPS
jgi:hypothetical protein